MVLAAAAVQLVPSGIHIVDAATGDGRAAITILQHRRDLFVTGVDIDHRRCLRATQRARENGVSHRYKVVCGSFFDLRLSPTVVVIANPPLLPGEVGFLSAESGVEQTFPERLIRRVAQMRSAAVLMHVFDFHGIFTGTGSFPALADVAHEVGCKLDRVYSGWRPILPGSNVLASIEAVASRFPLGEMRFAGRVRPLAETVVAGLVGSDPHESVDIAHSVLQVRRQ